MKTELGKQLWLHTEGEPTEIVVSSHGYRDRNDPRTIDLNFGYLPGTTVYFLVEDGVLSGQRLPQTIEGAVRRDLMHTQDHGSYLFDYSLRKFQKSKHGDGGRHSEGAQETYKIIGQQIDSNILSHTDEYRRAKRQRTIAKYGHDQLVPDFVNRGVISIRSGGRFKQQEVLLSDVIKAAQTDPWSFTTFWCLFCREIV